MTETRCYSLEQIDLIISETRLDLSSERKNLLAKHLEEHARVFLVEQRWQESAASPSDVEKQLDLIQRAATALLNVIPDETETLPVKREARLRLQSTAGSSDNLRSALTVVQALKGWAEDARNREHVKVQLQQRRDQRKEGIEDFVHEGDEVQRPRHSGDIALNSFLEQLVVLFEAVFERQAATSTTTDGRPDGPTIRFARACLRTLRENVLNADPGCDASIRDNLDLSPDALRNRIRTILNKRKGMVKST
ncbi:hypothetical protein [Noviherbaspirillum denitrificans]|uniref:Uncharacterized protein n=1 Tax=Noviherbaspirillum denitrificans TaxID=1968433 RepID=A0A254THP1_9BURK|nr:hypothetical protein [Noviherbaspirillum denitrificans]OWW19198.1 hypothetical protein AYR66_06485 [Noviherbaspirillum denitrificans]